MMLVEVDPGWGGHHWIEYAILVTKGSFLYEFGAVMPAISVAWCISSSFVDSGHYCTPVGI